MTSSVGLCFGQSRARAQPLNRLLRKRGALATAAAMLFLWSG
jgi:hypothetical protein